MTTSLTTLSLLILGYLASHSSGVTLWKSRAAKSSEKWRGLTPWGIAQETYIGSSSDGFVIDPVTSTGKVNQIFLSEGSYNLNEGSPSGTQFYATPLPPEECYTLSYKVLFEDGFNFAYGGRLPGLFGGGANCTTGDNPGKDCFHARFMWRTGGLVAVTLYAPQVDQTFCSDDDVACDFIWGHKLSMGSFTFPTNEWVILTQTVRLNTPNNADGYIRLAVSGQGVLFSANNVVFRSSSDVSVDGIFFSTYFGGISSCSASPQDQHVYFKTFQLKDNYC